MINTQEWIEKQWPTTIFLDPRIQKRVVTIGTAFLTFPDRNIPARFESIGATKGCYRFLSRTDMGHEMLQSGHYENIKEEASNTPGEVLFIQDGSELLYNTHKWVAGLGPTGDSYGNGIMFHSCLAVKFEEGQPKVMGLAAQKAWIRKEEAVPVLVESSTEIAENPSSEAQEEPDLESAVWLEMLEKIGRVPKGITWTTVCDRAGDIFSLIEGIKKLGYGCVIRTKHDRKILINDEEYKLKAFMRSLPSMSSKKRKARGTSDKSSYEQTLNISWTEAEMRPPRIEKEKKAIKGSYVRVWCEEDPDIEWILFTLVQVTSAEEALAIVSKYEHRWIIEEYHKCLKSGCKIEEAQLKTSDRLLNLFGILGIVATQLLQLRDISRIKPDEPAEKHADPLDVMIIEEKYKIKGPITVKEFWRRVAMLGGFLGRKSDKNPGWQTIWMGWLRLQDMRRGVELAQKSFRLAQGKP